MANFYEIIQKHQSDHVCMILQAEFDRLGIYDVLEKAVGKLEAALQQAKGQVLNPPVSLISTLSSNLLVAIDRKIDLMEHLETKQTLQGHVSSLALQLLNGLVIQFPQSAVNILNSVHEALQTTAELFEFDKARMETLLPIAHMVQLAEILSPEATKQAHKIEPTLIWNNKANIGLLTWALKDIGWIRKQQNFDKLFSSDSNEQVVFNLSRKYELAYLLYRLRSLNYIGTSGNKGYFSLAEKRIAGFGGETLTPNSLKKMSSKISLNPEKYRHVTTAVEEILDQLKVG
ncbi:MAG: hypothetical protein AAGI38_24355 [Bacteroidota bacterium]